MAQDDSGRAAKPAEQTDVTFRGADGVLYRIPKAALAQYAVPEGDTTGFMVELSGLGKGRRGPGAPPPFNPEGLGGRRASDACAETGDTGMMGCPG
jgi:hypothetical protein